MKVFGKSTEKRGGDRPLLADLYELRSDQGPAFRRQMLQNVPFLQGLPSGRLDELALECVWVEFGPGEEVIKQGDVGDRLYFVVKGRLSVFKSVDDRDVLIGELRGGQLLGEMALIEESPRSATVIAEEKCVVLSLTKERFDLFLEKHPELRTTILEMATKRKDWGLRQQNRPSMETLLKELGSLTGVEEQDALADLEREVEWVTVAKGVTLIKTGEQGEELYFVLNGSLDAYLVREDGTSVRIGRITKGEIVGEIALLTNSPRSADVIASEDSELLRLTKVGYDRLIARHPKALMAFSRTLASRLVGQLHARSSSAIISSMPIPTISECQEIVDNPDVVLRNLKITQMYHRLSVQLSAILGQHDANWCTFATHASKTAGNSIRGDELPGYSTLLWIEDNLPLAGGLSRGINSIFSRLSELSGIVDRGEKVREHVSKCIVVGNLKVFTELAPLFVAFLRTFQEARNSDPFALEELCADLEPGETASGGQQLIKEAFRCYVEAMFETDFKRKAELLFCGNVKIGLHEQMRLHPYILEALNTPIEDMIDPRRKYLGAELIDSDLAADADFRTRVLVLIVKKWRRVLTRHMMRLRLPYGDISLGKDLPRLPNRRAFPDVLRDIELPELNELLARFDRSRNGNLKFSRSRDWGNLDDRMNFIINLFRSRHKSLELFDQPFFYEQRLAMQDSIIPQGRL